MHDKEEQITNEAIAYARSKKKAIARKLTDITLFPPDQTPVSVFMAGSPGAGKTESSKNLIAKLSHHKHNILRIDPDELREHFPAYTGSNSHMFQATTSILADCIHDLALKNNQSFVFDGTLSNLSRTRENINRSLKRNRLVQILYTYQDPLKAWRFVRAREQEEGRHVPVDAFIEQYMNARHNVNTLKQEYNTRIKVDLIVKNLDGSDFLYRENINIIDNIVPERYSERTLKEQLQ